MHFTLMFSLYFYQCGPSYHKTYASTVYYIVLQYQRASFPILDRILKYESEAFFIQGYLHISRVSNIEYDNSQNVGLEDYNNISDGIFPYFTTPSIKITLG